MRILSLSPRQCWPTLSGAKLRDYYFARALGRCGQLTYVHFSEPGSTPLSGSELPFCRAVVSVPKPRGYTPAKIARGLMGRQPLPVLNYTSQEMVEALAGAVRGERFDLVHLESLHMAGYLAPLTRLLGAPLRVVSNWHNIESELMRRYRETAPSPLHRAYAARTAEQLEGLERRLLADGFGHVVCSEREREKLLAIAPGARVATVPNGVDTAYFGEVAAERAPGRRVVFVGLMDYHANVEAAVGFVREIWPQVRKRLPACRLTLVGARPVPAVLALREREGVEVTGTVPDVRPYYRDALAAIVPLRTGGGTRLKILEAMAAGVPVISTALGAEGLDVAPRANIVLAGADDAPAWTRELARLAEEEPWRQGLTTAALRLVRERYDWTALGESLCRLYCGWLEQAR
jgi:glycosyltransferase involved in cell wall biosynthesis